MKKMLLYIMLIVFSTLPIAAEVFKPELEYSDCFLENCQSFNDDPRIQFAFLTVPEDHENPDGRLLKLAIVFIKSADGKPEADPVIHLSGGPGGKSVTFDRINAFKNHPFSQNRDLIFIDFRGIGFSEPEFCPELQEEISEVISSNLLPHEATEKSIKHYADCFVKLNVEGLNLSKYNSAAVVKDLEMLRIALNIEQWNLWGISYGTRVAQTYLRDFPESVRCVIMDSPIPMAYAMWGEQTRTYQRSLTAFFNACKECP